MKFLKNVLIIMFDGDIEVIKFDVDIDLFFLKFIIY